MKGKPCPFPASFSIAVRAFWIALVFVFGATRASGGGRRPGAYPGRVPLPQALRVMARVGGQNFILPSVLRERTVRLPDLRRLGAGEAWGAFSRALEHHGLGIEPRAGFLLVVEHLPGERFWEWIEKQAAWLGLEILEMTPEAADPGDPVFERTGVRLRVPGLAALERLLGAVAGARPDLIVERVLLRAVFWEPGKFDVRFRVGRLRPGAGRPAGPGVTARLRTILAALREAGGLRAERLDLGPSRLRLQGTAPGPEALEKFLKLLSARPGFESIDPARIDLDPLQRSEADATGFKIDLDLETR